MTKSELFDELSRNGEIGRRSNRNSRFCHIDILISTKDKAGAKDAVEEWAKSEGINLFTVNGNDSSFEYDEKFGDLSWVVLNDDTISSINKPNTVIVLNDLDLMDKRQYRYPLFNIMLTHDVYNDSGAAVHLDNLLYTIGIINPDNLPNHELRELRSADAKDSFLMLNY